MRIAIVTAPDIPVPPYDGYGGIERGADQLATALVACGHDVTLLASGDSQPTDPSVTLLPIRESSLRNEVTLDTEVAQVARQTAAETTARLLFSLAQDQVVDAVNLRWENPFLARKLAQLAGQYAIQGIVSFSCSLPPFRTEPNRSGPTASQLILPDSNLLYTAHTESHRSQLGGDIHGKEIHVVPYGIDMSDVPIGTLSLMGAKSEPNLPMLQELRSRGQDYLTIVGTITRSKGQLTATQIARQSGMPLVIAGGKSRLRRHMAYFDECVAPQIDGKEVLHFGEANEQEKYELMRYATALLFCSGIENPNFSEPFGRVIAESLASGTPVLGYRKGSFYDLVDEGKTGLGFDTVEEAVEHVSKIRSINRQDCARAAREKMSVERFAQALLELMHANR